MSWKSVRSTDESCRRALRGHRPTSKLGIVDGGGIGSRVLRGLGLVGRITIELTSRGTILAPLQTALAHVPDHKVQRRGGVSVTYAAFQRPPVHVVSRQLAYGDRSILVAVHLDKRKAPIRLEPSLHHVTEVLKERYQIVLSGVRSQVSDVNGGLPLRSLGDDHVVALDTMCREVVVTVGSGRSHAHGGHSCLLRDRRLALLVGPVAADGARTEPFAVHGAQRLLGIGSLAEGYEAVSP